MSSPSIVRIASQDEYESVWALMLMNYKENAVFPLSERKARWHVERALFPERIPPTDTGVRGVIGVIGPKGALEGIVFVIVGSYWYSEAQQLEEMLVFVHPEHRKSDHAKSMISWMKVQVEETKLPLVTGVFSRERTEAKCRLYQRMMPKLGEFFLVWPSSGQIER